MERNAWYLVSSHGAILFFIAANPECTVSEIVSAMVLTNRTVWGLVGDLRGAGMLRVKRAGRRHHYTVNLDGPFLHPTISGLSLRSILSQIVRQAERRRAAS
jgi:DNA-binding IclR family transcriptional regulator